MQIDTRWLELGLVRSSLSWGGVKAGRGPGRGRGILGVKAGLPGRGRGKQAMPVCTLWT